MIGATNNWVVVLDNLTSMPPWLSDGLCRLSTGGGLATRTLYSDDQETFLDAMRPTILNGITEFISRGDLIDRCLFIHLPAIPKGAAWKVSYGPILMLPTLRYLLRCLTSRLVVSGCCPE